MGNASQVVVNCFRVDFGLATLNMAQGQSYQCSHHHPKHFSSRLFRFCANHLVRTACWKPPFAVEIERVGFIHSGVHDSRLLCWPFINPCEGWAVRSRRCRELCLDKDFLDTRLPLIKRGIELSPSVQSMLVWN